MTDYNFEELDLGFDLEELKRLLDLFDEISGTALAYGIGRRGSY